MTTPELITIQTAAPSRSGKFDGRVAQAYFVVKDNIVCLTDRDGIMLSDPDGGDYSRVLSGGDTPREIAGQLLRSFRTKFIGQRAPGFDRPIDYSTMTFKY